MTDRIYALYSTMESASTAIRDLMDNGGIASSQISVITDDRDGKYSQYIDLDDPDYDDEDVDAEEGSAFGAVVGTLTSLTVSVIPGLGSIVVAGPFAAALMALIGAGSGAVTGGIVAALVDFGVDEEEAMSYEQVLRDGGAIVIVDTTSDAEEDRAENILKHHAPLEFED